MVRQVPTPLLLPQLDANTKRGAHRVERDLLDKKQSLVGCARPVYREIDLLEEAAIVSKFAPIFGCIRSGRWRALAITEAARLMERTVLA